MTLNRLKPSKKKSIGPGKHTFKCYCSFDTEITRGKKTVTETCYVCDYIEVVLLRQPGIENLELISINGKHINNIES